MSHRSTVVRVLSGLLMVVPASARCDAQSPSRQPSGPQPRRAAPEPAVEARPADDEGAPIVIGQTHAIESAILGQTRAFSVGLPEGYAGADQRYPVLYVLDGESNFEVAQGAARFLAAYGKIPPLIVIGLHNAGRRTSEMTPDGMDLQGWTGTGDQFLDFFERELIPHVDATYRTHPFRILHGHSHGAIIGTYSFAARPDLFKWHLMLDMPPGRDDSFLEHHVLEHLRGHPDRVARMVSVERQFGWTDADWNAVVTTAPESVYLDRITLPRRESHETMLWEGTYQGLRSLFHDYAAPETRAKTLAALQTQYALMSRDYGYTIEIPQRLLEENVLDMVIQQRGAEARELFEHMQRVHHTRGRFQDWGEVIPSVIERGPPEESVADILAWTPPTVAQMAPYLGTWEGEVEAPFPFGLRVRIGEREGCVVVETTLQLPDGAMDEPRAHEALRLLPDGTLEWALYNNMRPFIFAVYSLRLEGDALIGHQAMRGGSIRNLMPDAPDTPKPKIRLTRRASGSE